MKLIKKIIVIGGSAGSIPSLCAIIRDLPAGLPAALLVVVHSGEKENLLPQVLQRSTSWKVMVPHDVERLTSGCLYVAAANRHLIVRDGHVLSFNGPRENRHRPSVDALFRSTARAHKAHVIAVVLSGALDDGSAGALAVKARRGTVIVEAPASAEYGDMPRNVQRYVGADHSLPAAEIPAILKKIVPTGADVENLASEQYDPAASEPIFSETAPEIFSCPECEGPLQFTAQNGLPQFCCHVGHVFSLDSFSEAESESLERAIWMAYRKLKEHCAIQAALAEQQSDKAKAARFRQNAEMSAQDIKLLHGILGRL